MLRCGVFFWMPILLIPPMKDSFRGSDGNCKCGKELAGRHRRSLKKDEVDKVEIAMINFPYAFSLQGLRGCRWGYGLWWGDADWIDPRRFSGTNRIWPSRKLRQNFDTDLASTLPPWINKTRVEHKLSKVLGLRIFTGLKVLLETTSKH
jgi:hypothetical protein